jgi:hypothetical protein
MKKPKRPKAVPYVLIPDTSEIGKPMYELLWSILDEHHEELGRTEPRIVLAWATAWKPDVDGRLVLGKCKKVSDLDRELAPFDFVILLNRDFWLNPRVTTLQRRALLDHELCHCAITFDENGDPKVDERGRTVYRTRKHTIEEFTEVVNRYGCYKNDIEAFAQALARAERQASGWVGYSSLQEALKAIGVAVDLEVITTWPETERREVLTWAQVRQEADVHAINPALCANMPACLASALGVREHTAS